MHPSECFTNDTTIRRVPARDYSNTITLLDQHKGTKNLDKDTRRHTGPTVAEASLGAI